MKRILNLVLSLILIANVAFGVSSCNIANSLLNKGEQFVFNSNGDGTCSISGKRDAKGIYITTSKIVIPSVSPDGEQVTSIADYAFEHYDMLQSVTIPNTVKSIGFRAFGYCQSLTSVTIPDSVTSINPTAFVESYRLTDVNIDGNNEIYKSIDGNVCSKDGKTFIICAPGKVFVDIPDSVTDVEKEAFLNCEMLFGVTLSNSMTAMENVFSGCTNLRSITIPENIKSISDSIFSDYKKLVEVVNNSSVSISYKGDDTGLLYNDPHIFDVHTGTSRLITQDDYIFYDYDNAKYLIGYVGTQSKLVLPGSCNGDSYSIYRYAFMDNSMISSVEIPKGVSRIGREAFESCLFLRSITISKSVKDIGNLAFNLCPSLVTIKYTGTVNEWNSISTGVFGLGLEYGSTVEEIACSDGAVKIGQR